MDKCGTITKSVFYQYITESYDQMKKFAIHDKHLNTTARDNNTAIILYILVEQMHNIFLNETNAISPICIW